MSNAEQVFRAKAPGIMAQLLRDFPITPLDAAAIVGNAGHESMGFTKLQEMKPTVAGSRGGWGWMQWTASRRRAFEAYCKRTGKDPASDDANYAWLFLELKGIEGTEGAAIGKTVKAKGIEAKVRAFELAFLRAGVKHYDKRLQWAEIALDAWRAHSTTGIPIPNPTPVPEPSAPSPEPAKGKGPPVGIIITALVVAAALAAFFLIRF